MEVRDWEKIALPRDVEYIIGELEKRGFHAHAVGGCVRDSLIGRIPEDWDITTNAKPLDVKKIFRRTIDTGIAHGTVTIMLGDVGYEVTTYRIDGAYSDGRHPDQIAFTSDLREDLRRRDFTINAMAYSDRDGLVDLYGGREDLKSGVIRCVGDARERFLEDALRILRAVRFRSQLGFAIEEETYRAAKELKDTLQKISKERIMIELTKLLLSDYPEHLFDVFVLGLDAFLAKDFYRLRDWDVSKLKYLAALPKQKHLHLSCLLSDFSASMIQGMLKELKLDNDTITKVKILVSHIHTALPRSRVGIKQMLSQIGLDRFRDLILLKSNGFFGTGEEIVEVQKELEDILNRNEPYILKDLCVNGGDLLAMGMQQGPNIKEVLHSLLMKVIEDPDWNEREKLMEWLLHRQAF